MKKIMIILLLLLAVTVRGAEIVKSELKLNEIHLIQLGDTIEYPIALIFVFPSAKGEKLISVKIVKKDDIGALLYPVGSNVVYDTANSLCRTITTKKPTKKVKLGNFILHFSFLKNKRSNVFSLKIF